MGLQVLDDIFGGADAKPVQLDKDYFAQFSKMSVRDFITHRVQIEYERLLGELNAKKADAETHNTKISAAQPERITDAWLWYQHNGRGFDPNVNIDVIALDAAIEAALAGFSSGAYFLLLDDRQAEHLDETFSINDTKEALFLRVTPLQGG